MPDESMLICYCHDVTLGELAKYIKENNETRRLYENRNFFQN